MNDIKTIKTYDVETSQLTEVALNQFFDTCHKFGTPDTAIIYIDGALLYEIGIRDFNIDKVNDHIFGFNLYGIMRLEHTYPDNTLWVLDNENVKYEFRIVNPETRETTAWVSYKKHQITISEAIR